MKKYNFFEIAMCTLSWALLAAMVGIFLGGYWYGQLDSDVKIKGVTMLIAIPSHPTVITSLIAIGMLLIANVLNHVFKHLNLDSHNIVFEVIVLVYVLIYFIMMFIITYVRTIAWYPMSFWICFAVGAICDILYARFCDLDSEDVEPRQRRQRTRTRARKRFSWKGLPTITRKPKPVKYPKAPKAKPAKEAAAGKEYVAFVDNAPGEKRVVDLIKGAILSDANATESADEFFAGGAQSGYFYATSEYAEINYEKGVWFCKYIGLHYRLEKNDWDWFVKYVRGVNGSKLFESTRRKLEAAGITIGDIKGGKASAAVKKAQNDLREEFRAAAEEALNRLRSTVWDALMDFADEVVNGNGWLGCSDFATEYANVATTELKFKNRKIADMKISKDHRIEIDCDEMFKLISQKAETDEFYDLFLDSYDDVLAEAQCKRYVIVDNPNFLKSLARDLKDRLTAEMKTSAYGGEFPAAGISLTVTAENLTTEFTGEHFGRLIFNVGFIGPDRRKFKDFYTALSQGEDSDRSVKKGEEYIFELIKDQFLIYLGRYYADGYWVAIRPWDTDFEFWSERSSTGRPPIVGMENLAVGYDIDFSNFF